MADEIRLSLPAHPDFARLARLAAASVAARLGFTYDELEDVRMAVGEAWSLLLPADAGDDLAESRGSIEVGLVLGQTELTITLQGHDLSPLVTDGRERDGEDAPSADLSRQVLTAVADEVDIDLDAGRVELRKRRSEPVG